MKNQSIDLDNVDIVAVARELGIQSQQLQRGKDKVLALCPFHKESTPSFTIFSKAGSQRPHYHCFGCQAHGGVLDLIVGRGQASDYAGAIRWLRDKGFIEESTSTIKTQLQTLSPNEAIKRFLAVAGKNADRDLMRSFATSRHFDIGFLDRAGLLAVDLDYVARGFDPSEDDTRILIKLGLIRRDDRSFLSQEKSTHALSSFASGARIVIPIKDADGTYVGALVRASRDGQNPKYKFPAGFERGHHLFGAHTIIDQIRAEESNAANLFFDLYITEGVFDALRVSSIGRPAVASFGASLTHAQISIIESIAAIARGKDRTLRVHLFYDMDEAGRIGTARALARLLGSAAEGGYLVDVVRPPRDDQRDGQASSDPRKDDPDSWIQRRQAAGEPVDLDSITFPALHALVASYLDDHVGIEDVPAYWAKLSWPEQFSVSQRLARRLKDIDYAKVEDAVRPHLTSLGTETGFAAGSPMAEAISALLRTPTVPRRKKPQERSLFSPQADRRPLSAKLHDASELAFEASNSREYPVDVGSWERIQKSAAVFIPLLEERLKQADKPIRPYTAHYMPRSNGKPRLKCGPCPEDAILQQYVLNELLRQDEGEERQERIEIVPAVRWWPSTREVKTTGRGDRGGETVSFGYQIDMSALAGRPDRPGGRRDVFRPFIECWNAYIAYAGRRISRMRGPMIHVARLDVRRFYDEIPRHLVRAKLEPAIGRLVLGDYNFCTDLAGEGPVEERIARIRDWILDHSFGDEETGYSYIDPLDGSVRQVGRRARGLPQGPTLSAYLATIALFDMDRRMVKEVEKQDQAARKAEKRKVTDARRHGALYARYVDDIILAASSEGDLRHLLSCVTEELAKAGLRANEKSEVMLPKTIAEAREWLVERRGAGFGYGDAEAADLPMPVQDGPSSWADVPGLDRRHILSLVLDPTLDDPGASADRVLAKLKEAAGEKGELRESDLGFFARRLLMRRTLSDLMGRKRNEAEPDKPGFWDDQGAKESALLELARLTVKDWLDTLGFAPPAFEPDSADTPADRRAHEALFNSGPLLALFDGVERMLIGRPDLNPAHGADAKKVLASAREAFILAVRHGFLDALRQELDARLGDGRLVLGAQLTQQQIILEERAEHLWRRDHHKTGFETEHRIAGRKLPSYFMPDAQAPDLAWFHRLDASWFRHFNAAPDQHRDYPAVQACAGRLEHLLGNAGSSPDVPFSALHLAICLLESLALAPPNQDNEVCERLAGSIHYQVPASLQQQPVVAQVLGLLKLWFPPGEPAESEGLEPSWRLWATFAFCVLLKGAETFQQLLWRRSELTNELAGVTDAATAELIPPPQVPNTDSIRLLFHKGDRLIGVVLYDKAAQSSEETVTGSFLQDFSWTKQPAATINTPFAGASVSIDRFEAQIDEGFTFLLPPSGEAPHFDPRDTADLVEAVINRARKAHDGDAETTALITPYSILYRISRQGDDAKTEVRLATWRVRTDCVEGKAFRRDGKLLVSVRTPHPAGDWLWRTGVSVADILNPSTSTAKSAEDDDAEHATIQTNAPGLDGVLRRKLFSRLQGAYLPPTVTSADLNKGEIPRHIQRTLTALKAASRLEGDHNLPYLVQHFIEGRAMVLRRQMPPILDNVPGGVSYILARLGQVCVTDGDDVFATGDTPGDLPFGRAAAAYWRVSGRLDELAQGSQGAVSESLRVAATGAGLWAMTIAWREFALALLARLDVATRQALLGVRLAPGGWDIGGSAFLVAPRFGLSEADGSDFDLRSQGDELASALARAFSAGRWIEARSILDDVSLLGWVVVAGMALAAVPVTLAEGEKTAERQALAPALPGEKGRLATQLLGELATMLASGPSTASVGLADDWPWELFDGSVDDAGHRKAEQTLRQVAEIAGIRWVRPTPSRGALSGLDGLDGQFRYIDPATAARFAFSHWQFVFGALHRERKPRLETVIREDSREELSVWTVIQDAETGTPYVISIASGGLARRTGIMAPAVPAVGTTPQRDTRAPVHADGAEEEVGPDLSLEPGDGPATGQSPANGQAPASLTTSAGTKRETGSQPEAKPAEAGGGSGNGPPASGTVDDDEKEQGPSSRLEWRRLQRRAWSDRKLDPKDNSLDRCYFRFAFLQIDFADGYEDPKPPESPLWIGEKETKREISVERQVWPDARFADRCSPDDAAPSQDTIKQFGRIKLCRDEWRRRRVLTEVLDACKDFGVNALLIPEYSVRAETVFWLARKIQEMKIDISIWAGTFRVPSNMKITHAQEFTKGQFLSYEDKFSLGRNWNALDAVLPVVSKKPSGRNTDSVSDTKSNEYSVLLMSRNKLYPAIAYEEIFRIPDEGNFRPITLDNSFGPIRVEAYVAELICSEIFAFNGPMNSEAMFTNISRIMKKIGQSPIDKEKILEVFIKRYRDFAAYTSYGLPRENWPRRTVIMMPCITKRAKDYHAFGTTMHLSAGSNIIFCNSSLKGYGGGESCVIGFRSWDDKPNKSKLGPYHGVMPGIYVPSDGDGIKPLGQQERALVIVDIDPINSALPNPRPQYVPEPVRLVAHLPIIEEAAPILSGWEKPYEKRQKTKCIQGKILGINTSIERAGIRSTLDLLNPTHKDLFKEINNALEELKKLFPDSPAMEKRRTAFSESHGSMPEAWPPPALVDWLAVDLEVEKFERLVCDLAKLENPNVKPQTGPNPADMPLIWLLPPEPVNDSETDGD